MEPGQRNRNREVAQILEAIGDLLEVKGELPFKIAAYRKWLKTEQPCVFGRSAAGK